MLSIFLAAVAIFAFGALWFTVLFGRTWVALMDFNPAGNEKAKQMGMTKPLLANFMTNVIAAAVMYYLFTQLLTFSYGEYLKMMLIVWLGFSFPIYANAAIWERKSWMLVVLNSAQGILAVLIASGVIYLLQ